MNVDKDTQMTVCGLLKSIIEKGTPKDQWEKDLEDAYMLFDKTCRKVVIAKGGGK